LKSKKPTIRSVLHVSKLCMLLMVIIQ
jgi:hypothetical protein